jgi:hypothetical protein
VGNPPEVLVNFIAKRFETVGTMRTEHDMRALAG